MAELRALLGVTLLRFTHSLTCVNSNMQRLRIEFNHDRPTLDYNELKRLLLRTLLDRGPMDGASLSQALLASGKSRFEIHSVRMALVRYYRQGLLKRVRSAGQFTYTLTDRGTRRLQWLEEQTSDPDRA
jgi:DNA-binding PadR family transcriptional regulator